jgi:hypothetical protein
MNPNGPPADSNDIPQEKQKGAPAGGRCLLRISVYFAFLDLLRPECYSESRRSYAFHVSQERQRNGRGEKLKKQFILAALLITLVLLVGAGCKLPMWSDVSGAWVASADGVDRTLTFGWGKFTNVISGAVTGRMECSYDVFDEAARRIEMTLTSASGICTSQVGTKYFMYYEIIGDSLYYAWNSTTYPTATAYGPYIRH